MKKHLPTIVSLLAGLALLLSLCLASAQAEDGKLNINTATVEELAKVPGLNAEKAKAIVDYREQMGDIKSLDELLDINGFDKALVDKLKDLLTTEGVGKECTC